jgi:hypothetical protein
MPLSRELARLISRLLIGVLLFAQFTVASYACPASAGSDYGMVVAAAPSDADMGMASAEYSDVAIDPDAANLCIEHCRFGQQSADTPATVQAPVTAAALLYEIPAPSEGLPAADRSFPSLDPAVATPPPPHAILHCVLRI